MTTYHKHIIIGSALAGLSTIGIGLLLLFTFPGKADLPEGFRTPIIAFEFAKTEADLSFLAGNGQAAKMNREKMDAGHRWDMVFPFAYGGFLSLLLLQLIACGHRLAWIGIPFSLLVIPFDINENFTLMKITEALHNSSPVGESLAELHTATWLKWGAIGITSAVLSVGFLANREYWSAAVSAIAALSIAVLWASESKPIIAEVMSAVIFLFFLYFAIKAGIQTWRVTRRNV